MAVLLAAAIGGVAWAAITAWLRDRFNANEILVSLMLVYVAQQLLAWLVQGPLKDPTGFGFPQSRLFDAGARVPLLFEGSRLHSGFLLALAAAAVAWWLLARSLIGFQLRVSGLAPLAARYAGYSGQRVLWFVLLVSGALAGLAGGLEVAGPIGQLTPTISPGYGFAAIIVAFVGRLHPAGIVLASFVMAQFYIGGELAQSRLGLPSSLTGVYQGLWLFFLLACDTFIAYRPRWRVGSAA
jgi:simple sugar transport system permease protein